MEIEYISILRWLHVIGACVLFGTGAGIAFFMVAAQRSANLHVIAHTAATVVIADIVFTTTAVIAQPVTGYLLAREIGWSLLEGWVFWSLALYVFTGLFWLPVVWIQVQLRNMAQHAVLEGHALPDRYRWMYRLWFACGFPAFFAVLGIIWLMLSKPDIPVPLIG